MQFAIGARHFQRHHDERQRKTEDHVGKAVDARHGGATQAEAVFGDEGMKGLHGSTEEGISPFRDLSKPALKLHGSQNAHRQQQDGAKQLQHSTDGNPNNPEWQQKQPNNLLV